jgi:ATP-dependent DNA helicase RecG
MSIVTIDNLNSLTLPSEIVDRLGIKPGDNLGANVDEKGQLVLTVQRRPSTSHGSSLQKEINRKNLETPIQFIKGVGPKIAQKFAKKGIITVEDALYLLPIRYEDRRELRKVRMLRPGVTEVFFAEVISAAPEVTRGGRRFFEAIAGDETGTISLKWFNYNPRYMKGIWQPGKKGIFTGEVARFGYRSEIHHPEVDWIDDGRDLAAVMAADPLNFGRTVPVYPLTEGLNQRFMRKVLKEVVDGFAHCLETNLQPDIVERHKLLSVQKAVHEVHFPQNSADPRSLNDWSTPAHRTLSFDELFFLELGLALKKRGADIEEGIPFRVTHKYTRPLLKILPYSLTGAQRRVLTEIKNDMTAPHPMHRLVQGDVGSGKTVVALLSALLAVENEYQVAIMAPTEILAEQHYLNIHHYCEQLGITVCLLTSGLKGKERKECLETVRTGKASIVIGTHAVIQEKVEFYRLGLGIIDEQHRFGVLQRGILKKKGQNPDILVMTATPIPRTLAMTVFGDLSLSVIDELPPGRSPILTKICRESQRGQVYRTIREEVGKGGQAYIIYPLVEESEKIELKAASQMAQHLAEEVFPDLRIGLLHGRMKPEEKEAVMAAFKTRETDILVATTVIEVGIDVPNAAVIVIEHAERFGLSQLHQLRGRVGRGSRQSRCLLLAGDKPGEDAEKRLKVMEQTCDGFKIAEADLEIRGPGDFLGTRQAGLPEFRVANIFRDGKLLEQARSEAFALIEKDPDLSLPENGQLIHELKRRWGGRLELARVA